MDDKNLELVPDKDGFLFEIDDHSLIIEQIVIIIIGILFLIMMWRFGIGEGLKSSDGHMFNRITGTVICVLSIIYGLVKILILKKQVKKIIFYTNKITKTINDKNVSIYFFNEIYKCNTIGVGMQKLRRYSKLKKYFTMIFMPIGILIIYFILILNYIVVIAYYRKIIFPIYSIILIENSDLEMIVIPFLEKQQNIKNYFSKYHNIDIKKLKITWFIPEKN
ncbi:hypothetical protein ACN09M_09015 [Aliarcobacter butzleri]|uniref:hypothetical protein n=1 Tax=Aliarcobacter butzleri TaxID=28197 RepID=UPI003AE6727B